MIGLITGIIGGIAVGGLAARQTAVPDGRRPGASVGSDGGEALVNFFGLPWCGTDLEFFPTGFLEGTCLTHDEAIALTKERDIATSKRARTFLALLAAGAVGGYLYDRSRKRKGKRR